MTDHDLTALLMEAIGKRIDDPAAVRLAAAMGKPPLKSATPNTFRFLENRKLGIEVGASIDLKKRRYWPPHQEGRRWVTWVSHAFLYPKYRGALPAGYDWQMDEATLRAQFNHRTLKELAKVRFELPPPRPGLIARAELHSDGTPHCVYLGLDEERAYVTIYPDSKPDHHVEASFFATWCALNEVLRQGRLEAGQLDALRERRLTPLRFLADTLDGLLWSGDVEPQYDSFCYAYMNRLMEPDDATALLDERDIFGESNYWRGAGEPTTEDSWTNFDRIAPRYQQRLEQWRRGEIRSRVD